LVTLAPRSGSKRWELFFRGMFSSGAVFRFVRKRRPMPPVEELVVVGRRSGVERKVLVQLIESGNCLYVAEPGQRSQWADNLNAAGRATVVYWDGRRTSVTAAELPPGAERDKALDSMPNNQPAPLRFLYRRARRHIGEVGRVFRLDPETTSS